MTSSPVTPSPAGREEAVLARLRLAVARLRARGLAISAPACLEGGDPTAAPPPAAPPRHWTDL